MKRFSKVVYITIISFLMFGLFSCSQAINPINESGKETLKFTLPLARDVLNDTDAYFTYYVKVTSSSSYSYETTKKEGEEIVIGNLREGKYQVYLKAEYKDYIYEDTKDVELKTGEDKSIIFDLVPTLKGGQITLWFRGINFDSNNIFNVSVKNRENKEVFSKNIGISQIINEEYVIPVVLKEGEYTVSLTGGNIDKEQYIVNDKKAIKVFKEEVTKVSVNSIPYKTVYVDGNKVGSTENDGSESNPCPSLYGAFQKVKNYTDPVKIIVSGNVYIDKPIEINSGNNITIVGQNNAVLQSGGCEIFNVNGGNLTLKDIEVLKATGGQKAIINRGTLNIDSNVYITDIAVKKDSVINVYKSLKCENKKETTLYLDIYNENIKVFNLFLTSDLDTNFIKMGNKNFYLNNRGECQRILRDVNVNITNTEDRGYHFKDISYVVKENDNIVVPQTKLGDILTFTIPKLKSGITYSVEIYSKYTSIDDRDESGRGQNTVGYTKRYYSTITVDSEYLDRNTLTVDLRLGSVNESSTIFLSKTGDNNITFPLLLTLSGSKGNKITCMVNGFSTNINYLPVDTYTVSLTSGVYGENFTYPSSITTLQGDVVNLEVEAKVEKTNIYYVDPSFSSGDGSEEKPYQTLEEAITALQNEKGNVSIVLKNDIEVSSKITIATPLKLSLIAQNHNITCPTGLFDINNQSCFITIKDATIISSSLLEDLSNNIVSVQNGNLTLISTTLNASSTRTPTSFVSAVTLETNGNLNIGNNVTMSEKALVLINGTSPINLISPLTSPSSINIKATDESLMREVIRSSDINIISQSIPCIKYKDNAFSISKDGKLLPKMSIRVNELDEIRKEYKGGDPLSLSVYCVSYDELKLLGKKIRSFPVNSVDLSLILDSSITSIEKDAFNFDGKGSKSLRSITISEGIKTIGKDAFSNSEYITSITLPTSVVNISANAFSLPPYLSTVETTFSIKDKIESIGTDALYNRKITCNAPSLSPTLMSYSDIDGGFEKSTTISEILSLNNGKPKKNLKIGKIYSESEASNIINNLSGIKEIEVNVYLTSPSDVTNLATSIKNFSGDLIHLYISDTNTTLNNFTDNSFTDCSKLASISFPFKIKNIAPNSFSGCSSLSSFNVFKVENNIIKDKNVPWKLSNNTNVDVKDIINKITGEYKGESWQAPLDLSEIQKLLETPGGSPQELLIVLENQSEIPPLREAITNYQSKVGLDFSLDYNLLALPYCAFSRVPNISSVVLPPNIAILGSSCFEAIPNLTEITIPSSVFAIGSYSFTSCSSLKSVTFEDTTSKWITSSNSVEFTPTTPEENARKLTSSAMEDSVQYSKVFDISQVEKVIEISNEHADYEGTYSFIFPVVIKSSSELTQLVSQIRNNIIYSPYSPLDKRFQPILELYLQYENPVIKDVFTDSPFTIPLDVPKSSLQIKSVSLHGQNITIETGAFMYNPYITSFTCDDTTVIKGGAFTGCSNLSSVRIGTEGLGSSLPANNAILKYDGYLILNGEVNSYLLVNTQTLQLIEGITKIGDFAFYGIPGLEKVLFDTPQQQKILESVGKYAFAHCKTLTRIQAFSENPLFTTLSEGLFYKSGLTPDVAIINIPANIKTIEPGVFYTDAFLDFKPGQGKKLNIKILPAAADPWTSNDGGEGFNSNDSDEILYNRLIASTEIVDGKPVKHTYTRN